MQTSFVASTDQLQRINKPTAAHHQTNSNRYASTHKLQRVDRPTSTVRIKTNISYASTD
jgi:hypothetical protein